MLFHIKTLMTYSLWLFIILHWIWSFVICRNANTRETHSREDQQNADAINEAHQQDIWETQERDPYVHRRKMPYSICFYDLYVSRNYRCFWMCFVQYELYMLHYLSTTFILIASFAWYIKITNFFIIQKTFWSNAYTIGTSKVINRRYSLSHVFPAYQLLLCRIFNTEEQTRMTDKRSVILAH